MNINFEHILRENLPNNIVQPRRGQIYVGFQCHQKCGFCYYKNHCNDKMFSLDQIKKQIDYEYDYGIRDFEITGGEPSEYLQLRSVCQYIKQKSPEGKIAVITNGGLWNSDIWDVIDEVLVSYHLGRNDNNYDKMMFPLGCTYDKVVKSVTIAHQLQKIVRTNTVVGTFNINGIDHILRDLIYFKPDIVNFLPVNLFDEATGMDKYIDYNIVKPILKRSIDFLNEQLPDSLKFIRYIPFCNMEGYEKYVLGHLQHIYDWFDWNVELNGVDVIEQSQSNCKLGRYGSTSISNALNSRKMYEKSKDCIKCKYFLICDGIEKTSESRLISQTNPSKGSYVKNFMQFIGQQTFEMYHEKYHQQ